MAVRGDGLLPEDAEAGASAAGDGIVYVLHPNCAVEEVEIQAPKIGGPGRPRKN